MVYTINFHKTAEEKIIKVVKYTLLIGFYGNRLAYILSGLWSAGRANFPIFGKDMPVGAAPWREVTATVPCYLSGLILVSAVLMAWAACEKSTT